MKLLLFASRKQKFLTSSEQSPSIESEADHSKVVSRNRLVQLSSPAKVPRNFVSGVYKINRWMKISAEYAYRIENYCYEFLAFSRHSVDLELNEEVMKSERFTEAPDHAGLKPDTMSVSKWYKEATVKVTFRTSHLSIAQVTLVLKQI